jgi:hypothetical protein
MVSRMSSAEGSIDMDRLSMLTCNWKSNTMPDNVVFHFTMQRIEIHVAHLEALTSHPCMIRFRLVMNHVASCNVTKEIYYNSVQIYRSFTAFFPR